jgi:hypothetical protein
MKKITNHKCLVPNTEPWHNFFRYNGMSKKKEHPQTDQDRKSDDKCTAGDLPEKEDQFEDTSWAENADHGESATEAERKNVAKTLPGTAGKEREGKK